MGDRSSTPNIVLLLHRRQLGLPRREKGRSVRHSLNNYRCDFQLLKCLLYVENIYLEVIAGQQVPRSNAPSFTRNRLFTNNYRTWFNLCTSPTSGPTLMMKDIFHPENTQSQRSPPPRPKIIEGVTVYPPGRCSPLPNSQHQPCILLLSKDGWLHQYSLQDAVCLSKIFLRTMFFSDNSSCVNEPKSDNTPGQKLAQFREHISSQIFTYQYMKVLDLEGSKVLIHSTASTTAGLIYKAHVILGLFPLHVVNHFVTVTKTRNLDIDLMNDLMIFTVKAGSFVSLYGLKDVLTRFAIDQEGVRLGQSVHYCNADGDVRGFVGDTAIGLPYTCEPILLDEYKKWSDILLFKVKAMKHLLRIGGIPFHYAVPTDLNCNTWSLRALHDNREVSRFHIDELPDGDSVPACDFHDDESGRILVVSNETATMYQVSQRYQAHGFASNCVCMYSQEVVCPSAQSFRNASETGYLRLIGSPFASHHNHIKLQPVVKKCFEIRVSDVLESEVQSSSHQRVTASSDQTLPPSNYPSTRSSYGRNLRSPRRFASVPVIPSCVKVLSVQYEDELDMIVLLHGKGCFANPPSSFSEAFYDVMVSMYDNHNGTKINSVCVEHSVHESEISSIHFTMDWDTIVYARTDLTNLVNYKVLRFCRKY